MRDLGSLFIILALCFGLAATGFLFGHDLGKARGYGVCLSEQDDDYPRRGRM